MAQEALTSSTRELSKLLLSLYSEQLKVRPDDAYIRAHAAERVVHTQAAVFDFYRAHLPARGRVLDWGCRHAPDACLMRAWFGPELQIDGSDFVEPGAYSAFHDYAGLDYQALRSVTRLPYEDDTFDAVVASGTLEHTAMDYESLKELYRVLKVNGRLVITYLPNRLSFEEWYNRKVRRGEHHRRLYGLGEIDTLLRRTGFYPVAAGYQTSLDQLPARALRHLVLRSLCWVLPLHWFSSTICVAACKVHSM
jgi:SAM-dependent methyltransferase